MSSNDSEQCRVSIDELTRDIAFAHKMDAEQGLADTPEQIVSDKVAELMHQESTDEDSIVVLMESEVFIQALRNLLGSDEPKELMSFESCNQAIIVIRLKEAAKSVLSEYVELGL